MHAEEEIGPVKEDLCIHIANLAVQYLQIWKKL